MSADQDQKVLALFRESGAMLDGHFVLSSGLHSARYLQCALVLQHPDRAARLGGWLADRIGAGRIDVVIGPALGGVIVAHEVARALGVRALFTERKQGTMVLRRGFQLKPAERVLLVEDVVTTGESLSEVAEIVKTLGGEIAAIAALVDRRGTRTWNWEQPLVSLMRLEIPAFDPADCPLCREHVPVDAPGSRRSS